MIQPSHVPPTANPYRKATEKARPVNLIRPVLSPKQIRTRKLLKRGAALLIVLVGLGIGITSAKALKARYAIVQEHTGESSLIIGAAKAPEKVDTNLLTKPGDGRITIALLGVGGSGHNGAYLTDSIKVVSVDALEKKATITSVPRDFLYEGSKINAIYTFAEDAKKGSGGAAVRAALSELFNMPITHFFMVDFSGMKNIVDAIGGITVDVPSAIYDPSFPADTGNGFEPFSIEAGTQKMDGRTALRYSRTRKTDSDFKRQERQNLVINAIRKKALSLGTLTNPIALSKLVDSLGSHLRTDLQIADMRSLAALVPQLPDDGITSYVLDTSRELNLLTSSIIQGPGYVEYPLAGQKNFSAIQEWYHKNNPDPYLTKEKPTIELRGLKGVTAKQLEAKARTLTSYGFTVTISTTPSTAAKPSLTTLKEGRGKALSERYLRAVVKDLTSGTATTEGVYDFILEVK